MLVNNPGVHCKSHTISETQGQGKHSEISLCWSRPDHTLKRTARQNCVCCPHTALDDV